MMMVVVAVVTFFELLAILPLQCKRNTQSTDTFDDSTAFTFDTVLKSREFPAIFQRLT